jgi:hypothetical protein
MHVAIYARVSTIDQDCEMQLRELREFATRHGWTAVEYVDTGFSGSKVSRPALDQLLKNARSKRFDPVAPPAARRSWADTSQVMIRSQFTLLLRVPRDCSLAQLPRWSLSDLAF